MATKGKLDSPHPDDWQHTLSDPEEVAVYRKQLIGVVPLHDGTNGGNIGIAALTVMHEYVLRAHQTMNPITDAFEFEFKNHRVQLRFGEACDE